LTWSISCIWLELRAEIQPKLVKLKVSPNPKSKLNENSSPLSKNDLRPTPRHRGNPDNVEVNAMPQRGGGDIFQSRPSTGCWLYPSSALRLSVSNLKPKGWWAMENYPLLFFSEKFSLSSPQDASGVAPATL